MSNPSELSHEQNSPVKPEHLQKGRRRFLKAIIYTAFGIKIPGIALNLALEVTPKAMDTIVPDEFRGVELPKKNEYFRPADVILQESFDIYNNWRRDNNDLPSISFTKRDNYLDTRNLVLRFRHLFGEKDNPLEEKFYFRLAAVFFGSGVEEITQLQIDGEIYTFSAVSIDSTRQLLQLDPGSGIVSPVIDYLIDKKSCSREELYRQLFDDLVDDEDLQASTEKISGALLRAKEFFITERAKKTEPLSCSIIIAYFLSQNNGDLYKSMWDSTLFLKMLVRNDLTSIKTEVNYDQAVEIAYLFKDEFSPHMSHNWLIEQFQSHVIAPDSPLYLSGPNDAQELKDFMPINKDGTYYHCLNLMTWAAVSMDPFIVRSVVLAYYNEKIGGFNYQLEHGQEKVEADISTAQSARNIQRIVRHFTNRLFSFF